MIVTEERLLDAMKAWERRHIEANGPLNGIDLSKECARLADLLGVMWFAKESEAQIPDDSDIAKLIQEVS